MSSDPSSILATLATPARNRYFYGKMMDVFHMSLEQLYVNGMRLLDNRLAVGSGVLCGLTVTASNDGKRVAVGPGAAIDPAGREIIVPDSSAWIDPHQLTDDCGRPSGDPLTGAGTVTLCLAYHECPAEPVPALICDCDTQRGCAYGTTLERYMLLVRNGLPAVQPATLSAAQCGTIFPAAPAVDFNRRIAACSTLSGACAAPAEDCVVLATITLKADGSVDTIDSCTYRPVLYSNAMLFELILCLAARVDACCGPATEPLVLSKVSGDNQTGTAGAMLGQPLVAAVNQGGNPVSGQQVTFSVDQGGGKIGADAGSLGNSFSAASGADGHATLPAWQLGTPGANTVTATLTSSGAAVTFTATAQQVSVILPVIDAVWPPNGVEMARNSPDPQVQKWWQDWEERQHIEITFSRDMDAAAISDPDPWLRLWELEITKGAAGPVTRARKVPLKPMGKLNNTILGVPGFTAGYIAEGAASQVPTKFLIQIRTDADTIVDTDNPPQLLDADFAGTNLLRADLDRFWQTVTGTTDLSESVWNDLTSTGNSLPSGDENPGGFFHGWFEVAPILQG